MPFSVVISVLQVTFHRFPSRRRSPRWNRDFLHFFAQSFHRVVGYRNTLLTQLFNHIDTVRSIVDPSVKTTERVI